MTMVLIWNIETFGLKFPGDDMGAALSVTMIASLIDDVGADVVLIQELRSSGVPLLADIVDALAVLQKAQKHTWAFDWIEGGIDSGDTPATVGWNEMTFDVTNKEGYGVLWRDRFLAKTDAKRSGGINNSGRWKRKGISYLDICLEGFALGVAHTEDEPRLERRRPLGLTQGLTGFPIDCATASYPTRSALDRDAGPTWVDNPKVFVIYGSRRPAYVTVNGSNGARADVVGYHAPNAEFAPVYGPIITMNALTPNNGRLQVFAGDWNTTSTEHRRWIARTARLYKMTSPLINDDGSCPSRSMVHACSREKTDPWNGNSPLPASLTTARDFAIMAGGSAPTATVRNVCELFLNPDRRTPTGGPRSTYDLVGRSKNSILASLGTTWKLVTRSGCDSGAIVTAFFKYIAGYTPGGPDGIATETNGKADMATAAALLYNRFVSDHLPVQVII